MQTFKKYIVVAFIFVSTAAFGDSSECREYITKVCGVGADTETTQIKLERDSNGNISQNASEISEDNSKPSDDNTNQSVDNSNQSESNVSIQDERASVMESYRSGSTSERIKYVAYQCCNGMLQWVSRNWSDFFTLLLAGSALLFAARAWFTAREENRETKRANALALKPYFEFVDAKVAWHSIVPYFSPSVGFILMVKNTGQSVALDVENLIVDQCQITYGTEEHSEIDEEKYSKSVDFIVERSKEINPDMMESAVVSAFPAEKISRKVINPGEVVEFYVQCPMINVPDGVKTDSASVVCIAWMATGEFSFKDSFSKETRTVKFRVNSGHNSFNFLGDGTYTRTGGDTGRSNAGVLTEKQ